MLLLAAPLAAQAQVTFSRTALGRTDCGTTSGDDLVINWTSTVTESGQVFAANSDKFRILVSLAANCPTGDTTTALAEDQTATGLSQSYPVSPSDFLLTAGITCGTADTIYVCVSLYGSNGTTLKGAAVSSSIKYDLTAPPVPINVTVAPGDKALYVTWSAGTGGTVAADHYEVTMTALDAGGSPGAVHGTQSFTGTSGRYSGLVNGVTYQATVVAVSAGGNPSAPSAVTAAAKGTPAAVLDYWDQYLKYGGKDLGGCGGGPAGALSLLGLAALLRVTRRRS